MKYDLAVAYRICPKISKVPPVYPNDKLKLAEFCLESFRKSVDGLRVKLFVLLDNCPLEYEQLFTNRFNSEDIELIRLDSSGNKGTFNLQIEILLKQNDSEYIYFSEDDYFYISEFKPLLNLIQNNNAGFVTPYEHPQSYSADHVIRNRLILFENRRYINVQHACLTFLTTKANLQKNKRYFKIFTNWFGSDYVVWGCITLGFTYFKYFSLIFNYRNYTIENLKIHASLILFALPRFIINRKYSLMMPISTVATHMESNFLSPGINWDMYFNENI